MIFIAEFLKSDCGLIVSFSLTVFGLIVSVVSLFFTTTVKRALLREKRIHIYNDVRIENHSILDACRLSIYDDSIFNRQLLQKIKQTHNSMKITCYPIFKKSLKKDFLKFESILSEDINTIDKTKLTDYLDKLIAQLEIKGELI